MKRTNGYCCPLFLYRSAAPVIRLRRVSLCIRLQPARSVRPKSPFMGRTVPGTRRPPGDIPGTEKRADLLMNDRWGDPPRPGNGLFAERSVPSGPANPLARPGMNRRVAARTASGSSHAIQVHLVPKKEPVMTRDSLAIVMRNHAYHVIAEDYSYKTEAYYTILAHELAGDDIHPSSRAVLDAFVVPVCLERAKHAGIPVVRLGHLAGLCPAAGNPLRAQLLCHRVRLLCRAGQRAGKGRHQAHNEQGQVPVLLPETRRWRNHPDLHGGLWPDHGELHGDRRVCGENLRTLFHPPREHGLCKDRKEITLSSLSPARYTHLSDGERSLLAAYRDHQEFL